MTHPRLRPAGLAGLLALVLVAGCGSVPPTGAPSVSAPPSGSVATAGPSAAPSGAAPAASSTPVPASSPAASCSDATATASFSPQPVAPDDPNATTFAKIEGEVQQIRNLTATTPVPRNVLDQAGLCAFLRQSMAAQNPPELVAATDRLYKQLLLIPQDASLQKLSLDLLTSQVVGFYDETSKQMYVISSSGNIGVAEQVTYAHEFDHALQDQAFGLKNVVGEAKDQGDQTLARTALVEGDAVLVMSLWAQQNLTPSQLGELAGASDPASTAALNAAPPILKETLLWPYTAGLGLALGAYQTSASFAGVDALFKNPPSTTEQLLHSDKLASREPAVPVALPADFAKQLGKGWKVSIQDTFGELQLGILMRTGDPKAGTDPAVGWGGDRVSLVEGPNGATAAVVDTTWDTAQAASDAYAKFGPLVSALNAAGKHAAVLQPAQNRVVLISADSATTLGAVSNALGLAQ